MEALSKSALRIRIRELVRAIPADQRCSESFALGALLQEQLPWQKARSVLLFAPLPDEPDITACLEAAWAAQKVAALPHFDALTKSYAACVVTSHKELQVGRFGVLEPAGCPVIPLNQLDLVLVPGVAFDPLGGRLGRGKGFYDRLLAEVLGHKCGVAYDVQIVPSVPVEPHDIKVDSILTPTRWQWCGAPRAA